MPTRCNRWIFIADLMACSTCFGHHHAHHQELESIIQVVAACRIWCLVFKLSVWCNWGLCVRFAGCSLHLLEPSGPVQDCNGIALPFFSYLEWNQVLNCKIFDIKRTVVYASWSGIPGFISLRARRVLHLEVSVFLHRVCKNSSKPSQVKQRRRSFPIPTNSF